MHEPQPRRGSRTRRRPPTHDAVLLDALQRRGPPDSLEDKAVESGSLRVDAVREDGEDEARPGGERCAEEDERVHGC
eukprot:3730406-Rhodomonas_salina.1